MKKLSTTLATMALLCGCFASTALAVDQTIPGAGNAAAAQLAGSSALVSSSRQFISKRIAKIGDRTLRSNVHDLVENRSACIVHRAGETAASKQAVVDALTAAGLIAPADAAALTGGALTGVLPPVLDAGSACPHLPQPFFSAPGSVYGGHHSYPGGLPIHESFNDLSDTSFAANYRRVYGHPGPGTTGASRSCSSGTPTAPSSRSSTLAATAPPTTSARAAIRAPARTTSSASPRRWRAACRRSS